MNGWLAAATALLVCGVGPAAYGVVTGPVHRRIAAQNLTTTLVSLVLLLLARGYARPAYVDTALLLAVLGPAGTLVYVRLLAPDVAERPPRPRRPRALTLINYVAVAAVALPLCAAADPGRSLAKLLVIAVLLGLGSHVTARAMTTGPGGPADDGTSPDGPVTDGPPTGGPVTGGSATDGPVTGGASTDGPVTGAPADDGRAPGGPVTGGPVDDGRAPGDPVRGGPVDDGRTPGGPVTGGPAADGPGVGR
ncbi:monovalent cation/H+ antiporter complex subunit F [Streptomyces varsoviensis]|uniref:monovalent cation/H+ antiporter complex subunit F n=1 Tax=Streptomyces varsoviensis TaxID=67373 RepID=UPI0033FAD000